MSAFTEDRRALSTPSNWAFKYPLTDETVAKRATASRALSDCALPSEMVACDIFQDPTKMKKTVSKNDSILSIYNAITATIVNRMK